MIFNTRDTIKIRHEGGSIRTANLIDVSWSPRGKPLKAIIEMPMSGFYTMSLKEGRFLRKDMSLWSIDRRTLDELRQLAKRRFEETLQIRKTRSL